MNETSEGTGRFEDEPGRRPWVEGSAIPPKIEIIEACCGGHPHRPALPAMGPLTFAIAEGDFLSLIGPPGCGAGNVLRMVAGLVPLTSGEIRIAGKPLQGICGGAGLVFRSPLLLGWRSVLENVLLEGELRAMNLGECRSRARRLLAAAGLADAANLRPHELTPADQKRAAIIRSLIPEPEILLIDDPFHGLDAFARENLAVDIQRLWLGRQVTSVLATTCISEAIFLSDHVALMSKAPRRNMAMISIDLPRPRRLDKEMTPLIADYCSRIRTAFQAQGVLS
jgi:NitT/TauT family transport system ATP-binding protein